MEQNNYNQLQAEMTARMTELCPEEQESAVRTRVAQQFEKLKASGQLDSLSGDEVTLLEDYRQWKATPKAVGGVFHWKRHSARTPPIGGVFQPDTAELPRYRSHKEVHALKIAAMKLGQDGSAVIASIGDGHPVLTTAPGWAERFKGSDGDPGYYVVYQDGYESWSPTKAFEEGYTRV